MLLTTRHGLSIRTGKVSMLLENKVCVIYSAGGSTGGAITHGYAREGARVFLAGRTQSKCDQVADEWLRPVLSNAKVAGRLVHGYTSMDGIHARSCV
jgi:NADP-dependent 3-hydroxy acid dehydrogenase YdfG